MGPCACARLRSWIDEYHEACWDRVGPRVTGRPREWLRANTRPLVHQLYGEEATDE